MRARTRELADGQRSTPTGGAGWRLVAHPARLAMFTIDALAAALARQAPLASRLGRARDFEECASPLYVRSGQGRARGGAAPATPLAALLAHLDNDAAPRRSR